MSCKGDDEDSDSPIPIRINRNELVENRRIGAGGRDADQLSSGLAEDGDIWKEMQEIVGAHAIVTSEGTVFSDDLIMLTEEDSDDDEDMEGSESDGPDESDEDPEDADVTGVVLRGQPFILLGLIRGSSKMAASRHLNGN